MVGRRRKCMERPLLQCILQIKQMVHDSVCNNVITTWHLTQNNGKQLSQDMKLSILLQKLIGSTKHINAFCARQILECVRKARKVNAALLRQLFVISSHFSKFNSKINTLLVIIQAVYLKAKNTELHSTRHVLLDQEILAQVFQLNFMRTNLHSVI